MDTTDAQAISSILPAKYAAYVTAGVVLLGIIGRVYHAIALGGGLIAIWNGLFRGTATPKADIAAANAPQPTPTTKV